MGTRPLAPLLDVWQWQADAACRGMAPAMFFSPPGERGPRRRRREHRAIEVCRACPVLDSCAAFAVSTRQPFGVWGGLTERQRDVPRAASRAA